MRARAVVTALLCAALGATVISQEHVYITFVEIRFDVTDRAGAFVKALGSEDFTVSDNDRPQAISSLDQQVQAPVSVALILDRSESVGDRFPLVLDSAAAFARSTSAGGATVARSSRSTQRFTCSRTGPPTQTRSLAPCADSVPRAARLFSTPCTRHAAMSSTARIPGRTSLVVTDGEDTNQRAMIEDALRMVRLAGARRCTSSA